MGSKHFTRSVGTLQCERVLVDGKKESLNELESLGAK